MNAPRGVSDGATNYGHDGTMRFDIAPRNQKNYEPNSFGGPVDSGLPLYRELLVAGVSGSPGNERRGNSDDFKQAEELYRLMSAEEQFRVADWLSSSLAKVASKAIVDRAISYFRLVDESFGTRLEADVTEKRSD